MIAHAVMDENGGIGQNAQEGDQTGKEICKRKFYARTGGWKCALVCKDAEMGRKAAEYISLIADNSHYGYSQPNRWTGYKAIQNEIKKGMLVDSAIAKAKGDFDCSSLVISCYIFAGLNHKADGCTRNMEKSLMNTGMFKKYTDDKHMATDDYFPKGTIYIADGHTIMCITDAVKEETEKYEVKAPYVLFLGSVSVREGAGTEYKKMFTAHNGDKYPYICTDEHTGWYWINTPKGKGCVSDFADSKKKYTVLVN